MIPHGETSQLTALRARQRHDYAAGVRLTERRPSFHQCAPLFQRVSACRVVGPIPALVVEFRRE
jgi:hypothetical protein